MKWNKTNHRWWYTEALARQPWANVYPNTNPVEWTVFNGERDGGVVLRGTEPSAEQAVIAAEKALVEYKLK